MTDEVKAMRLAGLENRATIRDLMRRVYRGTSGAQVLAMHMMESTILETDSAKVNPELVAHFGTLLYNLGVNHGQNITRIAEALLALANDEDITAERAELEAE